MAIYVRIRKIHETLSRVEYEVMGSAGPHGESLVVDKHTVDTGVEHLRDPVLRRAVTMIAAHRCRTGQWPDNLVKQS